MVTGFLKKFEHGVIVTLIFMMIVVVLISTLELGYIIIKDIISPPLFWLEIDQLLEIFGIFLLILIGVELLESIKAYLAEKVVHSEIVLEVALIAIARKVIILDLKAYEGLAILGIAALIISIAAAYYFLKRSTGQRRKSTAQGWDGALPDMTRHHYCPGPHTPLWMRRLEMSALLKGWRGGHV